MEGTRPEGGPYVEAAFQLRGWWRRKRGWRWEGVLEDQEVKGEKLVTVERSEKGKEMAKKARRWVRRPTHFLPFSWRNGLWRSFLVGPTYENPIFPPSNTFFHTKHDSIQKLHLFFSFFYILSIQTSLKGPSGQRNY